MLCEHTLAFLIRHCWVEPYSPTGRYQPGPLRQPPLLRPEERKALHYAALDGPLYLKREQWQRAYQVVRSFTKSGRKGSRVWLPRLWGEVPVQVGELLGQLPSAFASQGFDCISTSPVGRRALFRASETCRVEQLPEPYGKWLQHGMQRPQWERPVELQIEAVCQLTSLAAGHTAIDLELSTFAIPLVVGLGRALTSLLALAPPLQLSWQYLRTEAQWHVAGEVLDLSQLQ